MDLFDYLYYRLYYLFSKYDKIANTTSSIVLSLYQFLTILNLALIASIVFKFNWPGHEIFIPIAIGLMAINWYRYERNPNTNHLVAKWQHESRFTFILKGWILLVYLAVLIAIPWTYGFSHQ